MKKLFLLVLFVPLISFSQNETRNNNGLQNLLKQAEKLVGNIDFNKKSVETSDSDTEKLIINLWKNYSKAFEYKDYNKVASFFTFPATFGISSTPTTFNYKDELIDRYKLIREVNMQEGYKYSLLENHEFYQLSQNICLVKATYSRYDGNYNKIYTGKGVYFYKNVNGSWKLYAVDSL